MKIIPLTVTDALSAWRRVSPRILMRSETGCHEWTGSVGSSGYGKVRIGRRQDYTTHRVSWVSKYGEIPAGMYVLHRCDNRRCVNPKHLFLGTQSDNIRDALAKDRYTSPMSRRTHCPRGHAYSGVNANGARICRICQSAATLRHYHRTKKR